MIIKNKDDRDWIYAYASNGKRLKGARVIYDENQVPIKAEVKLANKSFITISVDELKDKLKI